MAPKNPGPSSEEIEDLTSLFTSLGLAPKTASELARQPKAATPFKALIDTHGLAGKELSEKQAAALVKLSAGGGKLGPAERGYVVEKIVKGDVKSPDQVTGELQSDTVMVARRLEYGHARMGPDADAIRSWCEISGGQSRRNTCQ